MKKITPRLYLVDWGQYLSAYLGYGSQEQHKIFYKEFGYDDVSIYQNKGSIKDFVRRYMKCGFPLKPVIKYCAKELLRGTQKDLRLFLRVLQEYDR